MKKEYVIYHNPRCSKSRQALDILEKNNIKPQIYLYLEKKLTVKVIKELLNLLKVNASMIIRKKEKIFKDLSLDKASDEELIKAISFHPILLERPIIKFKNKAIIGRPPEEVLKLLDK